MATGLDDKPDDRASPLGYASPQTGRTTPHLTLTALSIFLSLSAHISWVAGYFKRDDLRFVGGSDIRLTTALATTAVGLAIAGFIVAGIAWVKWHTDIEFIALLIPILFIPVAIAMPF